eukprot:TRINITY_DN21192_c0_g1_i1.p1 TRINITY_DN21192_c0_g1~~TRINITY_DN21192_c0_g1_i1.p1  ORF type:complete len:714 (+),score=78.98 TRINITY_DN21192_c0_g1_i1:254-2395(+)
MCPQSPPTISLPRLPRPSSLRFSLSLFVTFIALFSLVSLPSLEASIGKVVPHSVDKGISVGQLQTQTQSTDATFNEADRASTIGRFASGTGAADDLASELQKREANRPVFSIGKLTKRVPTVGKAEGSKGEEERAGRVLEEVTRSEPGRASSFTSRTDDDVASDVADDMAIPSGRVRRHQNVDRRGRESISRRVTGLEGYGESGGPMKAGMPGGAPGALHLSLNHKYAALPTSSRHAMTRGHEEKGSMAREHLTLLKAHDRKRHGRSLASSGSGADLTLSGNANPEAAGLYWTTIGLGSTKQEFQVQIDSGSDLLWVQCQPCYECATSSKLVTVAAPFQSSLSDASSYVSCTSGSCETLQASQSALGVGCAESDEHCYYELVYGDGSTTTGSLISDEMWYPSLAGNYTSSLINFGCSFNQSGDLLGTHVVDGLMGLGTGPLSITTQLTKAGVIANSYAHCLGGETDGGGRLILGTVDATSATVFTPLADAGGRPQYYVTMTGITVGTTKLSTVSESTFGSPANGGGVIFDSGTTLAVVPNSVYSDVTAKLVELVTELGQIPFAYTDDQYCWDYTGKSISDIQSYFPNITLTFTDAEMMLDPTNYIVLLDATSEGIVNAKAACFAWAEASTTSISLTVLGDVILRNRLVIYDAFNSRMGWADMDCSSGTISTQNVTIVISTSGAASSLGMPPLSFVRLIGGLLLVAFTCVVFGM